MASLSPLFDSITVMVVLTLVASLAAAGGFSRHRIGLITDLVHPLMLVLVLIGLVQMLSALNDPAAIGPALAVALAPVPWGLLIVAVLTPLSLHPDGSGDSVSFKALGSVLLTGVLCWCILMGSGPGVFLNVPAAALVAGCQARNEAVLGPCGAPVLGGRHVLGGVEHAHDPRLRAVVSGRRSALPVV